MSAREWLRWMIWGVVVLFYAMAVDLVFHIRSGKKVKK